VGLVFEPRMGRRLIRTAARSTISAKFFSKLLALPADARGLQRLGEFLLDIGAAHGIFDLLSYRVRIAQAPRLHLAGFTIFHSRCR